jgi:adenosine deaminase
LFDIEKGTQLSVSVNTDNAGVFATSLENEYALVVNALERVTNEDGSQKYSFERFSAYVRELIKMSNRQAYTLDGDYSQAD